MTNNFFKNIYNQYFKYGNPAMRYIGINVIIFLFFGIIGLVLSLGYKININSDFINPYLAFPGNLNQILFRIYTFLTYPFIHHDFMHILFNMLWLYWMGNLFLQFLKPRQFHWVFWGGAVFGAIAFLVWANFSNSFQYATLIGASAAVMSIFAAITSLIPNYSIRLLIFGNVRLKYIFLVYILLDIIGPYSDASNIGGNISHLGGALFGFTFILMLKRGFDIGEVFRKKTKLKIAKKTPIKTNTPPKTSHKVNQAEIDTILDKISKSGYEQLSSEEKQILFKARNQ